MQLSKIRTHALAAVVGSLLLACAQESASTQASVAAESSDVQAINVVPEAGLLKIAFGSEVVSLRLRDCSTTPYVKDHKNRLLWAEAAGNFRGAPALAILRKSHSKDLPDEIGQDLEIWLTDIRSGEEVKTNREIIGLRREELDAWANPRYAQILAKYRYVGDPTTEENLKKQDAQREEERVFNAQVNKLRIDLVRSYGKINLVGGSIEMISSKTVEISHGQTSAAFKGIDNAQIYAVAKCE